MVQKGSFLMVLLFIGCIGTDYVNDPVIGERIEAQELIAIQKGQSIKLSATYFDKYGVQKQTTLNWVSANAQIATIDQAGLLTAVAAGQTMVVVSGGLEASASISVNVVLDDSQVATVELSSPNNKQSIIINESIQLTTTLKNIKNEVLTGKVVQWFSENSSIATINSNGLLTGVSNGMVDIHSKSEGVKSNVISFSVGGGRSGSFVSAGGYKAVGMAMITLKNGNLILEFSNNFETSFALGTYVYLANATNGAQVKASGLEVAQITDNGAKSFNLSALKPGISLYDYNYVIILCKPATVTFGYAELK